jgi:hypothetical protein
MRQRAATLLGNKAHARAALPVAGMTDPLRCSGAAGRLCTRRRRHPLLNPVRGLARRLRDQRERLAVWLVDPKSKRSLNDIWREYIDQRDVDVEEDDSPDDED